jgi:hypothetical protein
MRRIGPLLLVVGLSFSLGCHRTVYYGLSDPATVGSQTVPVEPTSRWQHFFLFGWVPSERTIDARAACGGTHKIREIRTRQTFLQGLIETLASYYVNIYSPWTGEVVCQ